VTLSPGTRLGPYEVLGQLGAGGMGEVWRARDSRLQREVAIKVLPGELSSDAGRLKRFEKEARSASALNHPNIVTIYEIGFADSVSFIAMELVEGKTLRELLFAGPLPIKRVLAIAAQAADGLARAHEAGIVHRDLKPENVMVAKDGRVKILDFGLAKLTHVETGGVETTHLPTETGTDAGTVLGTVGYMSPEQASGQPVDFRSDQFSFGSILYEVLTGKRAFQRKSGVQTLAAIIQEEPEPVGAVNPLIPAPLRWIVERCLAKDSEARYASTKDLAHDLASLRDHLSEASVSGAELTAKPFRALRRLPAATVALALLGALAIGVFAGHPLWKKKFSSRPTIRQVTFRRAATMEAGFAPDGQIVYADSSPELFSTRPGTRESRSLGLPPANLMSISSSGELAILLGGVRRGGTLATVPLGGGGAPRELLENVRYADWTPDGKRLAVIHAVEGKIRLEFPIGKVLYQGQGGLSGGWFSPKGDLIAFGERHGWVAGAVNVHDLRVVDLAGKVRKITKVPYEYRWSPQGDEIWFNEIREGITTIEAVTLSGRKRFLASFPGDFTLCDISRDGRILLSRESQDSEIIGGSPGKTAERNLSWLDGSVPADLSADGETLLFSEIWQGGGPNRAVYKRKTDGSPAVRLGEGLALALSPDGRWALSRLDATPSQLTLLPTGAGQPRTLSLGGIRMWGWGRSFFFPDGKRILIRGAESGTGRRLYVLDIETGKARPITPEGIAVFVNFALSPDGKSVVAPAADGKHYLYDVAGGPARPVPALSKDFFVIRWCADGHSLFVGTGGIRSLKVYRLDLSSGRKEFWKEFSASAGDSGEMTVIPTPDGKSYVYGYTKWASDLFVAEGLK
jgi:serine/threonine protein kinase/Tol biopolymer transport system component